MFIVSWEKENVNILKQSKMESAKYSRTPGGCWDYLILYEYCSSNIYLSLNFSKLLSHMLNINSRYQNISYSDNGNQMKSTLFWFCIDTSGPMPAVVCRSMFPRQPPSLAPRPPDSPTHLFSQKASFNPQRKMQLSSSLPLPVLPLTQTYLHLTLSLQTQWEKVPYFYRARVPSSL